MIIFLLAGIACFGLFGFQLVRPRLIAERDRRAALAAVRPGIGEAAGPKRSILLARLTPKLAKLHTTIWRRQSEDDVAVQLQRAGASRRLSAELFLAGRVALTIVGLIAGFTLAHGAGRFLLGIVFAAGGILLPGFVLSKAAARRAERIDDQLPHFVDQLAIAIEAGMTFDAALTYLTEATDGPLIDEMRRVMAELRVGESRRAAIRSFALRVGSDEAMAFANAVLASDQLGSPLAGILRSQAADLRHRRQLFAEERAQKTPVKMLFPMVIFILPVMFAIILGPAFLGDHGIF